jgi:hypothetical protein
VVVGSKMERGWNTCVGTSAVGGIREVLVAGGVQLRAFAFAKASSVAVRLFLVASYHQQP